MSPLAILLHAWRLRQVRWALRRLNRRMAVYEAAYGRPAILLDAADLRDAGLAPIARP